MTENVFISILMVTYNSSWDKTRQTLKSIINQNFQNFEIIIADDGSKENNYELIKDYFQKINYSNYKLVNNSVNKGTVENIISGLNYCNGDYIKLISPGDFFYNTNTLKKIFDEIKGHREAIYLTRYVFYKNENDKRIIYDNKMFPKDIRPYNKQNYKKIKYNYLLKLDLILGAAVIYKANKLKEYIVDIKNYVKYAEDTVMLYMIANNEKILPLNTIGGWYEYSTGISTTDDERWTKIITDEISSIFILLYEKKIIPKWLYEIRTSKNWKKRQILKFLHCPFLLCYRFKKQKLKGYSNLIENDENLKDLLNG